MSERIDALAREAREGPFQTVVARFEWLQEQLSPIAFEWTHSVDPMIEFFSSHATAAHGAPIQPPHERWIAAANVVSSSFPDPDDQLYALLLAGEVWALGLRYSPSDMARFLRRLSEMGSETRDPSDQSQNAYQTYEHLLFKLMPDLDEMLQGELEDEALVSSEWSVDPDTVANAVSLLCQTVQTYRDACKEKSDGKTDDEELDAMVSWSGHYLWAAYHAKEAGIPFAELSEFVGCFSDDWIKIFRALIRDGTLVPGVLSAISAVPVEEDRVVREVPELVEAYLTYVPTPDGTLREYLTMILTANALEA